MKQIAVVSGKGGTGKTTLSGALENLFENHIMVDCDVDAANLHLYFEPKIIEKHDFIGGKKAVIHSELCNGCGLCSDVCRFDAVLYNGIHYTIDQFACEGCNACALTCPTEAVTLEQGKSGEYYLSSIESVPLVHANLNAGEDNSGDLVAVARKLAVNLAKKEKKDVIVIDGAPGIGCAATSSIIGVQYVVVVTEPTISGIHDMKRIIETIEKYNLRLGVIINKWDINEQKSQEIYHYCNDNNYKMLGKIPFDITVVNAAVQGKAIIQFQDSPAAVAIREIFNKLYQDIFN